MARKCKHKWETKRTIWPYPEGYGVCCKKCETVLETGMLKHQAEDIVKDLNSRR